MRLAVVTLACVVFLAAEARARDGVIEINQTSVEAAGGFPFTLSAPGSYRLTGDLVTANAEVDAIVIASAPVTLDLGGFSISGPVACAGVPTTCPGGPGGAAVRSNFAGVTVRNGAVRGMGYGVVLAAFGGRIEGVHASSHRWIGLQVGPAGSIVASSAHQNGAHGIEIGPGSVAIGNGAGTNGADGIEPSAGSVLVGNASANNDDDGYAVTSSDGTVMIGNTARGNTGDGFAGVAADGADGMVLAGNVAYGNGPTGIGVKDGCALLDNEARNGAGDGIRVDDASLLLRNSVRLNAGTGLAIGGVSSGLGGNATTGNLTAQIARDGNDLVLEPNLCGADAVCF